MVRTGSFKLKWCRTWTSAIASFVVLAVAIVTPTTESFAAGEAATTTIKLADGKDIGTATFFETSAGILIRLDLTGVPPGAHGLRVHENGVCEGDFSSAGAIFNPLGAQHGFFSDEGPMAGDLPNVYAAADGTIKADILSPLLSLAKDADDGIFDTDGAALVLFAGADDYLTETDGNAGLRIACGKITPK